MSAVLSIVSPSQKSIARHVFVRAVLDELEDEKRVA